MFFLSLNESTDSEASHIVNTNEKEVNKCINSMEIYAFSLRFVVKCLTNINNNNKITKIYFSKQNLRHVLLLQPPSLPNSFVKSFQYENKS